MDKDKTAFFQRLVIVAALGAILGVLMNIKDAVKEIRDDARQWHAVTEGASNGD